MTRLKKEKGYRLGDLLTDGRRIIALIPLRYLGCGRHQIKTDGDYIKLNKFYLDYDFMSKNLIKTRRDE